MMSVNNKKRSRCETNGHKSQKKRHMPIKFKFDVIDEHDTIKKFLKFYDVDFVVDEEESQKSLQIYLDECKENSSYVHIDSFNESEPTRQLNLKFEEISRDVCLNNTWKIKVGETQTHKSINNTDNNYLTLNDIHVGDIISVNYTPSSQRYIEYYDDLNITKGIVLFIDIENDNAIILIETKRRNSSNTWTIKSLTREGCHFFGMSRCYEYSITRFE